MRRASEASLFFLAFPRKKKPLHNGSYEHRVPKIKTKHYSVPGVCVFVCVIQHRTWPLRSTILNAHGTNASPDGLCTRTHTNEAFSCWFCCNSFRVDRARRGNVCLEDQAKDWQTIQFKSFQCISYGTVFTYVNEGVGRCLIGY